MIPDEIYDEVFHSTFKVSYTEEKTAYPESTDIKRCEVFASRPRDAETFKETVDMLASKNPGSKWPQIKAYIDEELTSNNLSAKDVPLEHVLTFLQDKAMMLERAAELGPLPGAVEDDSLGWTFNPDVVIRTVYDVAGSIVAGDWDGMALGHPPDLPSEYKEVYNTFAPPPDGRQNMAALLASGNDYLDEIKTVAIAKPIEEQSAFEKKALSIESMADIVSDFALARAGCITPHEFLFQQVLNDAYRDEANKHYGEDYGPEKL